jgi:hypothetical protein
VTARADEFARVKVKLCALIASLDETVEHGVHAEEFDQGAAHASAVTVRQLRAILDETALGAPEPQASPELAAAMAEAGEIRKVVRELIGMFHGISGGWGARTSISRLSRLARQAGIEPPRAGQPGEPDEADAHRELLDRLYAALIAGGQDAGDVRRHAIGILNAAGIGYHGEVIATAGTEHLAAQLLEGRQG